MAPTTAKLERLLNLVAALLDTSHPLTADEIRERVGGYGESATAFHRAFERDKDELRAMGIDIAVRTVADTDPPSSGYLIDRRAHLGRNADLEPDELAALHVAASLVRLQGDAATSVDDALRKLGGVVDHGVLDAGASSVALPADPALATLFAASAERRVVRFRYRDQPRDIEPHRIAFTRGHWYLHAHDRSKGDDRLFRIDRIEGDVAVLDERFARRPTDTDAEVRAWELGDDEPVDALLAVDADQAAWALHQLGAGSLRERHDDGSVVVAVRVRNVEAFRSFVLSLLDHAVVLEPPALRAEIVRWLEGLR